MQACVVSIIAPHAGARIETQGSNQTIEQIDIAPHAGARIETLFRSRSLERFLIAPHAGARIETLIKSGAEVWFYIAPHAGARIETANMIQKWAEGTSPPTRGRGLKHSDRKRFLADDDRPPRGGAD